MYPGTKIQLIDKSTVTPVITTTTSTDKPLYAVFFTSPRGPERFTILEGEEWAKTYLSNNTPDFYKDGQPLLQAAMNANAGAKLFSKRIVADDALLASATYAIALNTVTKTVETTTYTKDNDAGTITIVADDADPVELNQMKLSEAKEKSGDDTLVEGDKLAVETTTDTKRAIQIRPITYSFANDAQDENYSFVDLCGGIKENIYNIAKKNIESKVMSSESYEYEVEQENGDKVTESVISISLDGVADPSGFKLYTDETADIATGVIYPLFTIFDSGRGVSDKLVRIVPNYAIAKSISKMIYSLQVLDKNNNNAQIETWTFSVDPNAKDSNLKSLDIQTVISGNSNIIDAMCHFESFDQLIADLEKLGVRSDIFTSYDMLGRKNLGGKSFTLTDAVDTTAVDGDGNHLQYTINTSTSTEDFVYANMAVTDSAVARCTVVPLENGSAGSIKSMNESKEAFYNAMDDVLTGRFSKDIFNLDLYTFDCIFDANYNSDKVKRGIQRLCAYRGDCVCFMDMCTDVTTLKWIQNNMAWDGVEGDTKPDMAKFFYYKDQNVYVTSLYYDIKNPFNGRQITVTAAYSLSNRMVSHFINGRQRAFAGQTMGITIPEAIEGTVNFIPKIYPKENFTIEELNMTYPSDSDSIINEKQELCDIKVNYGTYYNGVLTMDTLFTTYPQDSELSYINNVMGAQLIIKEIRKTCPTTTRYNFIDSDSLSKYQEEIQDRVIDRYAHLFDSLSFEYIKDATYEENKIFYGAIKIGFKAFTQSEYFKVTAINANANA